MLVHRNNGRKEKLLHVIIVQIFDSISGKWTFVYFHNRPLIINFDRTSLNII